MSAANWQVDADRRRITAEAPAVFSYHSSYRVWDGDSPALDALKADLHDFLLNAEGAWFDLIAEARSIPEGETPIIQLEMSRDKLLKLADAWKEALA